MSTDPLTAEEVMQLLAYTTNGTTDITSKRSQDVKDLDLDLETLSLNDWVQVVHEHPGILRRPLLLSRDHLVVGYNKEEYQGIVKKYLVKQKKKWDAS